MDKNEHPDDHNSPSIPTSFADRLLRLMGMYLVFTLLSLTLGFAFWLILHGVFIFLLRVSRYWKPAYQLLSDILGINLSNRIQGPIPLKWWRIPIVLLWIGVAILFVGLGVRMLIEEGFLGQNIIYWIVSG